MEEIIDLDDHLGFDLPLPVSPDEPTQIRAPEKEQPPISPGETQKIRRNRGPRARQRPGGRQNRRSLVPLLWIIPAILGVAGALFVYNTYFKNPSQQNQNANGDQPVAVQDDSTTQIQDADSLSVLPVVEDSTAVATVIEDDLPTETATTESSFLRSSEGIDPAAGGYAIVVASVLTQEEAEGIEQRYKNQGYRTGILVETTDGITRFRIGLGQFPTISAATASNSTLRGSGIPADAWVRRIQ